MTDSRKTQTVLGLDVGQINTRAALFGLSEGSFKLLGHGSGATSLGSEAGITAGIFSALKNLQHQSGLAVLNEGQSLVRDHADSTDVIAIDQVPFSFSAGPRLRTVVMGLTRDGSLRAGKALASSLPLALVSLIGLAELGDEHQILSHLVSSRPELIIIAGGEDAGAEAPVRKLVYLTRLACLSLPSMVQPQVVFVGNPLLTDWVRRRLDPLVNLRLAANLQPALNDYDLIPAQNLLDDLICRSWLSRVQGLKELTAWSDRLYGTKSFLLGRMVRFLNRAYNEQEAYWQPRGVLALDLGGGSTVFSAALGKHQSALEIPAWDMVDGISTAALEEIIRWMPVPVGLRTARMMIHNRALHPAAIPSDVVELALSQALARYRLRHGLKKMAALYPDFAYDPEDGLQSGYEPVIASGAVLTNAPTPGQSMLILLDALQPKGISTFVLDRYHLLPLMGAAAKTLPVLPVQSLDMDAFLNLGTVISPVSGAPEGHTIMVLRVEPENGQAYTAEITQGSLRRLSLPFGTKAKLTLKPARQTDVGFGGPGVAGRLAVTGGALGLVVDARGRPLRLKDDEEAHFEQIRSWLWALGG